MCKLNLAKPEWNPLSVLADESPETQTSRRPCLLSVLPGISLLLHGQSVCGEWPSALRQARYGGLHLRNLNAWRERIMINGNVFSPKHATMAKTSRRSTSARPCAGSVA